MVSVKKRVKRHMEKMRSGEKENQVDKFNAESIEHGLQSGAKSVKILHPTKGLRDFSMSRMNHFSGTNGMWNTIAAMINKARLVDEPVTETPTTDTDKTEE